MDLVFLGSGAFGVPTLARLAETHRLRSIVTQPDRPAGRGGALTPTPVAQWAAQHAAAVPILKPERVNAPEVVAEVRELLGPDTTGSGSEQPQPVPRAAMVVIAFGQKLGRPLLDGFFAINLHASLLPRWRGAAPINAAILAGDPETGNSIITLAERMDAGLILGQSRRPILPEQTAGELHDLLSEDGPALVLRVLEEFARGDVRPRPQDEALVTLAPKLTKADGWVDFAATAEECRRRVHGLTPWPGVTVRLRGEPLKLLRVQVEPAAAEQGGDPGRIVDAEAGVVACGRGSLLRLLEVQPAGKRKMMWSEFARGARIGAGERLKGGRATEC